MPKEIYYFAHGIKRWTKVFSQERHDQDDSVFVSRILKYFVDRYAMVARIGGDGISGEKEANIRLIWMYRFLDHLEIYKSPIRGPCSV